jgi:hypothetical protein
MAKRSRALAARPKADQGKPESAAIKPEPVCHLTAGWVSLCDGEPSPAADDGGLLFEPNEPGGMSMNCVPTVPRLRVEILRLQQVFYGYKDVAENLADRGMLLSVAQDSLDLNWKLMRLIKMNSPGVAAVPPLRKASDFDEALAATDDALRWCDQNAPGQPVAPSEPQAAKPDDPEQMVSPTTIAARFGLTPKQKERLRHQLGKWRTPANCREWTEVPDRRPRQPQYLYRLGSVQHIIDAIRAG